MAHIVLCLVLFGVICSSASLVTSGPSSCVYGTEVVISASLSPDPGSNCPEYRLFSRFLLVGNFSSSCQAAFTVQCLESQAVDLLASADTGSCTADHDLALIVPAFEAVCGTSLTISLPVPPSSQVDFRCQNASWDQKFSILPIGPFQDVSVDIVGHAVCNSTQDGGFGEFDALELDCTGFFVSSEGIEGANGTLLDPLPSIEAALDLCEDSCTILVLNDVEMGQLAINGTVVISGGQLTCSLGESVHIFEGGSLFLHSQTVIGCSFNVSSDASLAMELVSYRGTGGSSGIVVQSSSTLFVSDSSMFDFAITDHDPIVALRYQGLIAVEDSVAQMQNTVFSNISVSISAAETETTILLGPVISAFGSSVTVLDCVFADIAGDLPACASCQRLLAGGAVAVVSSQLELVSSLIDNVVLNVSGWSEGDGPRGGAVYAAGASVINVSISVFDVRTRMGGAAMPSSIIHGDATTSLVSFHLVDAGGNDPLGVALECEASISLSFAGVEAGFKLSRPFSILLDTVNLQGFICSGCTAEIRNATVNDSSIYVTNTANISIYSSRFTGTGSCHFLHANSSVVLLDTVFVSGFRSSSTDDNILPELGSFFNHASFSLLGSQGTVLHSIFLHNTGQDFGGTISVATQSSITIFNSTISNSTVEGGGDRVGGCMASYDSTVVVHETHFDNCRCDEGLGGGLFAFESALNLSLVITSSTALVGPAVHIGASNSVEQLHLLGLMDNGPAAVYIRSQERQIFSFADLQIGLDVTDAVIILRNVSLQGIFGSELNISISASAGFAQILVSDSVVEISDCHFQGHDMYVAMFAERTYVQIARSSFSLYAPQRALPDSSYFSSKQQGVLAFLESIVLLSFCEFHNSTISADGVGGAVSLVDSELSASNCLFQFCSASAGGALAAFGSNISLSTSTVSSTDSVKGGAIYLSRSKLKFSKITALNIESLVYGEDLIEAPELDFSHTSPDANNAIYMRGAVVPYFTWVFTDQPPVRIDIGSMSVIVSNVTLTYVTVSSVQFSAANSTLSRVTTSSSTVHIFDSQIPDPYFGFTTSHVILTNSTIFSSIANRQAFHISSGVTEIHSCVIRDFGVNPGPKYPGSSSHRTGPCFFRYSELFITDSEFIDMGVSCSGTRCHGGSLFLYVMDNVTILDTVFRSSGVYGTYAYGGAIGIYHSPSVHIDGVVFEQCWTAGYEFRAYGGAMYVANSIVSLDFSAYGCSVGPTGSGPVLFSDDRSTIRHIRSVASSENGDHALFIRSELSKPIVMADQEIGLDVAYANVSFTNVTVSGLLAANCHLSIHNSATVGSMSVSSSTVHATQVAFQESGSLHLTENTNVSIADSYVFSHSFMQTSSDFSLVAQNVTFLTDAAGWTNTLSNAVIQLSECQLDRATVFLDLRGTIFVFENSAAELLNIWASKSSLYFSDVSLSSSTLINVTAGSSIFIDSLTISLDGGGTLPHVETANSTLFLNNTRFEGLQQQELSFLTCRAPSVIYVSNCSFEWIWGNQNILFQVPGSSIHVRESNFTANRASGTGALFSGNYAMIALQSSTFINNSASAGWLLSGLYSNVSGQDIVTLDNLGSALWCNFTCEAFDIPLKYSSDLMSRNAVYFSVLGNLDVIDGTCGDYYMWCNTIESALDRVAVTGFPIVFLDGTISEELLTFSRDMLLPLVITSHVGHVQLTCSGSISSLISGTGALSFENFAISNCSDWISGFHTVEFSNCFISGSNFAPFVAATTIGLYNSTYTDSMYPVAVVSGGLLRMIHLVCNFNNGSSLQSVCGVASMCGVEVRNSVFAHNSVIGTSLLSFGPAVEVSMSSNSYSGNNIVLAEAIVEIQASTVFSPSSLSVVNDTFASSRSTSSLFAVGRYCDSWLSDIVTSDLSFVKSALTFSLGSAYLSNLQFVNITSSSGLLYISSGSIHISDSSFVQNRGKQLIIGDSPQFSVIRSNFTDISAPSLVTLDSSTGNFSFCLIENVVANTGGVAKLQALSSVTFHNCIIRSIDANAGSVTYATDVCHVRFVGTSICNVSAARIAGVSYHSGGKLIFESCSLRNLSSTQYGFMLVETAQVNISDSFLGNISNGAAFLSGSGTSLFVSSVELENIVGTAFSSDGGYTDMQSLTVTNVDGTALYQSGGSVFIFQSEFFRVFNRYGGGAGSAVRLAKNVEAVISHSNFTLCKSSSPGGATSIDSLDVTILRSSFTNCSSSAGIGGAVHFVNSPVVAIRECDFSRNSAANYGGAVAFEQSDGYILGCHFNHNRAEGVGSGGGAVFSDDRAIEVDSCTFEDNESSYGTMYASLVSEMNILFDGKPKWEGFSNLRLGTPIHEIQVSFVDHYGSAVMSSGSVVAVSTDDDEIQISGTFVGYTRDGLATLTNVGFYLDDPLASERQFLLFVAGGDLEAQNRSATLRSCPQGESFSTIDLRCLPCPLGFGYDNITHGCEPCDAGFESRNQSFIGNETLYFARACAPCHAGTFSDEAAQASCRRCPDGYFAPSGSRNCFLCPEHADCTDQFIRPSSGWYRAWDYEIPHFNDSDPIILECPNQFCLNRGDDALEWMEDQCHPNHEGLLCGMCIPNTAKSNAECAVCVSDGENWFYLALCLLAILILITILTVAYASLSVENPAIVKITISFVQTLAFLNSFLKQQITLFLPIFEVSVVVSVSYDLHPLECLLHWDWYQKGVAYLVTLALVIAVPFVVLKAILCCAQERQKVTKYVTVCIITMVMQIHPKLTAHAFRAFPCSHVIDAIFFLTDDLSIECYTLQHYMAMAVSSMVIIVFSFGFPVLMLVLLVKGSSEIVQSLGFFKAGYVERFYWWECVILGFKVLLGGIGSLTTDIFYRCFFGILVYLPMLIAQWIATPFRLEKENLLFRNLLLVGVATMFIGMISQYTGLVTKDPFIFDVFTAVIILALNLPMLLKLLQAVAVSYRDRAVERKRFEELARIQMVANPVRMNMPPSGSTPKKIKKVRKVKKRLKKPPVPEFETEL